MTINRRHFLKLMGAGTGAAALLGTSDWTNRLPDVFAAADTTPAVDPIWQAINRLGYGVAPGQLAEVKQMGLDTYIAQQLNPAAIDDSATDAAVSTYSSLPADNHTLFEDQANKMQGDVATELNAATVLRAIYSKRQLLEVMTNFWSEHFNIYHNKNLDPVFKTADDRDVVRKFALGKFRDLLGASAHSPAMLDFLDNTQSTKQHPNENYGREVLELHTLGVGNYTETDVAQVAAAFTGWGYNGNKANPQSGDFQFNPKIHDTSAKTVLGHTITATGEQEGEAVLDILASHPATAKHIATKLAIRFIGDNPTDTVINTVAQAFTQSSGDITATLRTLFATSDFMNAGPKYKRPWEYVVSTLRAFNAQSTKPDAKSFNGVLYILKTMGHMPFDHVMADGYADIASKWEGNMLLRWNFAIAAIYGQIPNFKTDLTGIVKGQNVPIDPTSVVNFFGQHLYGRALTSTESNALFGYLNKNGTPDLTKPDGRAQLGDTLALMLAAPGFQYR